MDFAHKLKNKGDNDEDSSGIAFTSCNPSNTKFLKTFNANARKIRDSLVYSNHNQLQEPSFRQDLKKIAVSLEKNSYYQYWIEDNVDFCPTTQQTLQSMYHDLSKLPSI